MAGQSLVMLASAVIALLLAMGGFMA